MIHYNATINSDIILTNLDSSTLRVKHNGFLYLKTLIRKEQNTNPLLREDKNHVHTTQQLVIPKDLWQYLQHENGSLVNIYMHEQHADGLPLHLIPRTRTRIILLNKNNSVWDVRNNAFRLNWMEVKELPELTIGE